MGGSGHHRALVVASPAAVALEPRLTTTELLHFINTFLIIYNLLLQYFGLYTTIQYFEVAAILKLNHCNDNPV